MKNMKIALKLAISFIIVIVLAVIVGAVGIVGMNTINNADDTLYNFNVIAISEMGEIRDELQRQRSFVRDYGLNVGDDSKVQELNQSLNNSDAEMKKFFASYEKTITDTAEEADYFSAKSTYEGDFATYKQTIYDRCMSDDVQGAKDLIYSNDTTKMINVMVDGFTVAMNNNNTWAKEQVDANTALFTTMTIIEIVVLVIAVIVAIFLIFYISGLIGKPTKLLSDLMNTLVKTGDFHIDATNMEKVAVYGKLKDETGVTAHAFGELMDMILTKCDTLEAVAGGDLTMNVALRSDKDTLGSALRQMVDSLNKMFGDINSSSNQVSTGSVQIADGAQLLAQGATEQSATVEELSASVAEIATQTKTNADTANETSNLAETIKVSAEQGSRQMEQMMQAVAEINESSKSIGRVIKIIDDIAFQTNILALNAAVEAARAGQHGKGFAVVADEVRSLAAKSAEAAKNTNELIESSIQKAEQGASISAETSESLQQIVDGILKTSELVATIAKSSNEQSVAISQIGEAIDQVSQVVQQNSATAEESAAASEEMSGQATLLQQLIAQFKIKDAVSGGGYSASAAPSRVASISSSPETGFSVEGGGKY